VRGDVPPDGVSATSVEYCPTSIILSDIVSVPIDNAEFSVCVPLFIELAVVDALSVTMTFACTVFPAIVDGNAHVKVFDVDVTPVHNWFAISAPVTVFTTIQL
jgi:hypothetical protein